MARLGGANHDHDFPPDLLRDGLQFVYGFWHGTLYILASAVRWYRLGMLRFPSWR
jgi:hypothetical protein